MPENMLKWFVGVERKHPVTVRHSLRGVYNTVYEASESTATPDLCAVLSRCVDRDRAAVRSVLSPARHPEPTSRLTSVTRKYSFLRNAT